MPIPSKRILISLIRRTLGITAMLVAASTEVYSADLVEVYALAEQNDPQYRQAEAAVRITREQRPQALAGLLPTISFNANTRQNYQEIDASFGAAGDLSYNSYGYSLDANQPVYRHDRFLALRQADSSIQQSEAELVAAQQELMVRVSERYFEVLAAKDSLDFAQAEKKSLNRQLEQAQQRFEVGLTAITDVQEARAGYDRAVAEQIAAENRLDNARERLREIIGNYLYNISALSDAMPLVRPQPEAIETWTDVSLQNNPNVAAATHAVDVARREVKIQNAGHLPTLDIVARRDFNKSGGRFGDTEVHSSIIGLELNVPIYQGGMISSRGRAAHQRLEQQLERLEQAQRNAHRLTRESYLGVISGISLVQALKQALVSSETALQATEAGFEVGTRTAVDVVAAERVTFQARRDYSRARYDYLLNTLRLKQAAGTLSSNDIAVINQWLN